MGDLNCWRAASENLLIKGINYDLETGIIHQIMHLRNTYATPRFLRLNSTLSSLTATATTST